MRTVIDEQEPRCPTCGEVVKPSADICPRCGSFQPINMNYIQRRNKRNHKR